MVAVIEAVVPPKARKHAVSVLTMMKRVLVDQPEVVLIEDVTLIAKLCSRTAPLPMKGAWTGPLAKVAGVVKDANSVM